MARNNPCRPALAAFACVLALVFGLAPPVAAHDYTTITLTSDALGDTADQAFAFAAKTLTGTPLGDDERLPQLESMARITDLRDHIVEVTAADVTYVEHAVGVPAARSIRAVAKTADNVIVVMDLLTTGSPDGPVASSTTHILYEQARATQKVTLHRSDASAFTATIRNFDGSEDTGVYSAALSDTCEDACQAASFATGLATSTGCAAMIAAGGGIGSFLPGIGTIAGAIVGAVTCGVTGSVANVASKNLCVDLACDSESPDFVTIVDMECPFTGCRFTAHGASSTGETYAFARITWTNSTGNPLGYGARTGTVRGIASGPLVTFNVGPWKAVQHAPCADRASGVILFSGHSADFSVPVGDSDFIGCL